MLVLVTCIHFTKVTIMSVFLLTVLFCLLINFLSTGHSINRLTQCFQETVFPGCTLKLQSVANEWCRNKVKTSHDFTPHWVETIVLLPILLFNAWIFLTRLQSKSCYKTFKWQAPYVGIYIWCYIKGWMHFKVQSTWISFNYTVHINSRGSLHCVYLIQASVFSCFSSNCFK